MCTGGGSGIGRAVCQVLAREGAKVAVVDQNEAGANETAQLIGADASKAYTTDVSSSSSVRELLTNVQTQFSDVPTVLVNSAGITRDAFLLKMKEENFDKVIDVNLKGTFLVTQALARMILENKIQNASFVNIASIVGKIGNIGQSNYAPSKAGVLALTKTAALEFGRMGIRVNAVVPGFIDTPMTSTIPDKVKDSLLQLVAMGRMGRPEEIAEACLFLASDRSSYMTGTSIDVTGGMPVGL
ncbi:estradiol 17-beta-dehydrogenase 8-like [Liolophura sinensis]|uniref:estradiol 17-beta-dehydrogenase 8-like n=1 Tax=Liolophura sinensis TaxID=3198878 RepID=UPI0031580849